MIRRLVPSAFHSILATGLFAALVLTRTIASHHLESQNELDWDRIQALFSIAGFVICAAWLYSDRRLLQKPTFSVTAALALLTWPIGIPIYLFASRGWTALFKLICLTALLLVSAILGGQLGSRL
jgi:hypothetical protein